MPYDGTGLDDEVTLALLEARRLVQRGWCQRSYTESGGRMCLHRALAVSTAGHPETRDAVYARVARLVSSLFPHDYKIQDWNDRPERTQDQVLALLDLAVLGGTRIVPNTSDV